MGRYDRIGLGKRPTAADRKLAHEALEHVGIDRLADRQLKDLSGGQKQRTLIARALVGEPNVLVLDEPTNGMDLVSTTQILGLFREALYGALVIAVACSVLGVYVVLRRIVFVGAALAQLSSAGIALAMFLSGAGIG